MQSLDPDTFSIANFEGPLDLLWHLIHQNELDIYDISLHQVTEQYLAKLQTMTPFNLDGGAEFIASAAALVCLKSKKLLPKHEQEQLTQEEEGDPRFEIIHQLMDYCRFREAAKELAEREHKQSAFYLRGVEESETKKHLGINHLSLDDLAALFRHVLTKAEPQKGTIHEEVWRVGDKIKLILTALKSKVPIPFGEFFSPTMSREELIVTFLALLELMKTGDACIAMDPLTQAVSIQKQLQR